MDELARPASHLFRMRILPVGETELRTILPDWFHQEFGSTGFTWAMPDYYAISEVRDGLIGRLGIFDREVEVAHTSIRVGGIGGVITQPDWCLRRIASDLTRAAVLMRDEMGVDVRYAALSP